MATVAFPQTNVKKIVSTQSVYNTSKTLGRNWSFEVWEITGDGTGSVAMIPTGLSRPMFATISSTDLTAPYSATISSNFEKEVVAGSLGGVDYPAGSLRIQFWQNTVTGGVTTGVGVTDLGPANAKKIFIKIEGLA